MINTKTLYRDEFIIIVYKNSGVDELAYVRNLLLKQEKPKFNMFLKEMKTNGIAVDWEINADYELSNAVTLRMSGIHKLKFSIILIYLSYSSFLKAVESISKNELKHIYEDLNIIKDKIKENENDSQMYFEQLSLLNRELTKTKRELERKNIELEVTNEEKNRLLGMAAHDLRNPLNAIMNFSEYLLANSINNGEDAEMLKEIHKSSGYMLSLVNDLLNASEIAEGKVDLNKKAVYLSGIISHSTAVVKELASRKNIKIIINDFDNKVKIEADENKMISVMENLIANAIKYSFSEGVIEISVKEKNDKVIITVKDEGMGIKKDEIKKLFKPYSITSNIATGGEKSIGLGLLITKKIVEAHNGKITVESIYNRGSIFTVSLPRCNTDIAVDSKSENMKIKCASEGRNVLVADDSSINRKVLGIILKRLGYNSIMAENGITALNIYKSNDIDIVLLDIEMPLMNGIETAEMIKKINREAKIYAISGNTNVKSVYFDGYIEKPFNEAMILEKLCFSF